MGEHKHRTVDPVSLLRGRRLDPDTLEAILPVILVADRISVRVEDGDEAWLALVRGPIHAVQAAVDSEGYGSMLITAEGARILITFRRAAEAAEVVAVDVRERQN